MWRSLRPPRPICNRRLSGVFSLAMENRRVIVVTGPTASGKSALALALAEHRFVNAHATVINADAMQTYDAFRS